MVDRDLGGYDKFRNDFIEAGKTQFGSGWCWLTLKNGKLEITKTPNGENPLVHGGWPLLGCDVWEHSYYIDYRNLRPKYLETWFDTLMNWEPCRGDAGQGAQIARQPLVAGSSHGRPKCRPFGFQASPTRFRAMVP